MELLNGKAKELFLEYYWQTKIKTLPMTICKREDIGGFFETLVDIFQHALIIEWLRKEHKTDITIITDWIKGQRFYYSAISYINNKNEIDIWIRKDESGLKIKHEEHEEATTEAIKKAVEIINESNGK